MRNCQVKQPLDGAHACDELAGNLFCCKTSPIQLFSNVLSPSENYTAHLTIFHIYFGEISVINSAFPSPYTYVNYRHPKSMEQA